ncbi:MAG TPA: TIGR04086 family membrane protein [Bacillota bacterium]
MIAKARALERSYGPEPAIDLRAVIAGVLVVFMLTVLAAALLAVGIYVTDMTEAHVAGILYYIGLLAIACGGAVASRKAGTRGWLHGALTGILYGVLSLALGALLFPGVEALAGAAVKLAAAAAAGLLGGIVGINL